MGIQTVPLYLFKLTEQQRGLLYKNCRERLRNIEVYKNSQQKTTTWHRGRRHMMSGSMGSNTVNHGYKRYPDLMKYVKELLFPERRYSAWMASGVETEGKARDKYKEKMQERLNKVFNDPDRGPKQDTHGCWYLFFRRMRVELGVDENGAPRRPILTVIDYGFLIDKHCPWRGASPDGVVCINGKPMWLLEIKVPGADGGALYVLWKLYYYDQLQNELHVCRQHFGAHITFVDTFVYSRSALAGTLSEPEPFVYDEHYFYTWYLPRETHFFATLYLPEIVALDGDGTDKEGKEHHEHDAKHDGDTTAHSNNKAVRPLPTHITQWETLCKVNFGDDMQNYNEPCIHTKDDLDDDRSSSLSGKRSYVIDHLVTDIDKDDQDEEELEFNEKQRQMKEPVSPVKVMDDDHENNNESTTTTTTTTTTTIRRDQRSVQYENVINESLKATGPSDDNNDETAQELVMFL